MLSKARQRKEKIEKKGREKGEKKEEGRKIEKRMNYLFFEIRIHNLY
jgi:hypothetical protein